jgi:hypothetical protein
LFTGELEIPSDLSNISDARKGYRWLGEPSSKAIEMKDEKVYAKRDINEEKIEIIPDAVKGGLKDVDKDARVDAKAIDKEAKRVRRDKL